METNKDISYVAYEFKNYIKRAFTNCANMDISYYIYVYYITH